MTKKVIKLGRSGFVRKTDEQGNSIAYVVISPVIKALVVACLCGFVTLYITFIYCEYNTTLLRQDERLISFTLGILVFIFALKKFSKYFSDRTEEL